ncbi:MAG: NUDIX domain-containing protein [Chloroflexi bacterium]|nr:NUDIX domain-containing protein [Chloroflexota bacterium]
MRETLEETGYHITIERILAIYSSPTYHHTFPNGDQVKNVGTLFLARLVGGQPAPDTAEISAIAWLLPEEIVQQVPEIFATCMNVYWPWGQKVCCWIEGRTDRKFSGWWAWFSDCWLWEQPVMC